MKLTQRLAHGLSGQIAYTWQKELVLGTGADTSYLTPGTVIINDVFDYDQIKQLSAFSMRRATRGRLISNCFQASPF